MFAVTLAVATMGAAAPAAAAVPPDRTSAFGTVATDGDRVAAWVSGLGVVRVADEATGTIADHATPGRCASNLSELAVGGGRVALLCWDDARIHSRLVLLELASGGWRELPDPGGWREQLSGGFELLDVGARWLRAATDAGEVLVDLRDGSAPPVESAVGVLDLDAERLYAPACASSPHPPIAFERPYALVAIGHWVALSRCDGQKPVLLDDHADRIQLGAGIVSWEGAAANASARAYLPRCRLILAWPGFSFDGVAHTRAALYAARTAQLRRYPFPRRCPRPTTLRVRPASDRAWTTVTAQLWPAGGAGKPLAMRPPGATTGAPVVRRTTGPLELRLPRPATMVRWRIGSRRWEGTMQGSDRRAWRIPGPRRRGLTRIAIEARDDRGVIAQRYLLAIRR